MTHEHSKSVPPPDLLIWQGEGSQLADDALYDLDAILTGEHGAETVSLLCDMARGALANKTPDEIEAEIAQTYPTAKSAVALNAIKRVLSLSNRGKSLHANPTVWSTMTNNNCLGQLTQEAGLIRRPKYPIKQSQVEKAQAQWQRGTTFIKLAAYGISLRATPPEARPQRSTSFSPSLWQGRPESGLGSW